VSRHLPSPQTVCTSAVRASATNLKASDLIATCTSTWQPGADVTVNATYPYSISLFGIISKSGRLSSTTTERVE
jgi:hypothetical protein